ncbi:MAG: hypothetical protein AAF637_17380 [Pseudomonadota bacterium]
MPALARLLKGTSQRRGLWAGENPRKLGSKAAGADVLSDDQTFRAVWLVALLLMVAAAAIPLAGRARRGLRQAAIWVLVGGFLFAFYRIAEWLAS